MLFVSLAIRLAILGTIYVVLIAPSALGYLGTHVLRAAVLAWVLFLVSKAFAAGVPHNPRLPGRAKDLLATGYAFFALAVVLEAVFVFVPRSHGASFTYAARNWSEYFWRTNSRGYRDKPISAVDIGKPRMLVVGDSFAAGHGIANPADTFPSQLQAMVGEDFEVLNLGKPGADTRSEFRNLLNYPLEPDVLILQYFGNDIEGAAESAGLSFAGFEPYAEMAQPVRLLVQGSFLLNYLYWQFPHSFGTGYLELLDRGYRDPAAMEIHLTDLGRFVEYAERCDVPLLVVLFPRLLDIEGSRVFTEPVRDYFAANGVPVVDVAMLVDDVPPGDRIVNVNDAHASVLIHERVAAAISAQLSELGWLERSVEPGSSRMHCSFG